jgi:hypothetical protein
MKASVGTPPPVLFMKFLRDESLVKLIALQNISQIEGWWAGRVI